MPTNPTTPNSNAAIDRLALGVDSPRGTQPSFVPGAMCPCFEAEASGPFACMASICFEGEASNVGGITICAVCTCACFETE